MHDGMQCWGPEPCVAVGDHRRATFHDLALREAARGGHLPSPDPLLGYLRMDLRWPSPRADLAQASRVYLEAEYRMDWRRPGELTSSVMTLVVITKDGLAEAGLAVYPGIS
jgi:hypothetical protein